MPQHLDVFLMTKFAGPGYRADTIFQLSRMEPYSLSDLIGPLRELTPEVALYLPRTSDLRQIAQKVEGEGNVTVMHYCMEGASKVGERSLVCLVLANEIPRPYVHSLAI